MDIRAGDSGVLPSPKRDCVRVSWLKGDGGIEYGTAFRTLSTAYVYDALGRAVSKIDPSGGEQKFRYDGLGRLKLLKNRTPQGTLGWLRSYDYDHLDRLKVENWSRDLGGNAEFLKEQHAFLYDSLGHLLKSSSSGPEAFAFARIRTYDALGRLRKSEATGLPTLTYEYDTGSRKAKTTDSTGNYTSYGYDSAGRMKSVEYGSVSPSSTVAVVRSVGFVYQDATATGPDGVAVAAGKSGRIASSEYAEGAVGADWKIKLSAEYDAIGRSRMRTWRRPIPEGAPEDLAIETKLEAVYGTADRGGLVTSSTRKSGTGDYYHNESYGYDAFGQTIRKTTQSVDGEPAKTTPTQYDASGNQPYANAAAASSAAAGDGDDYRPREVRGVDLKYDGEGNVTFMSWIDKPSNQERYCKILVYDAGNRLRTVWGGEREGPGGRTFESWAHYRVDYDYDAEGNLVKRTETWLRGAAPLPPFPDDLSIRSRHDLGSSERRYVLDGSQTWGDADAGGTLTDRYVYGPGVDRILARVRLRDGGAAANQSYYYLTDRQNGVLAVIRPDQTRVKSVRYIGSSAVERKGTPTDPPLADRFEYTGRDFDAVTGLQYNRARWLWSRLGRFVSEDSLPDTVTGDANPYRYVKNSAANATDPSGHISLGAINGGWFDRLQNFSAGWADTLTFGATGQVRQALGYDDVVDRSSSAYSTGSWFGAVHQFALLRGTGKLFGSFGWKAAQSGTNAYAAGNLVSTYADWSLQNPGMGLAAGRSTAQWADIAGQSLKAFGVGRFLAPAFGAAAKIPLVRAGLFGFAGYSAADGLSEFAGRDKSNWTTKDYARSILPEVAGLAGGWSKRAMESGAGWAARNVLPTRFGRAAALAERNLWSGTGYAAGFPVRLADGLTGKAIGRGLHERFDGGRFEGAMQATADWLRLKACFAAGTKLMARGAWGEGYRCIEDITESDEVLSRSEFDAAGPVEWKRVEETFTRFAEVVNLHVGGQIVRTTSEHPFFAVNRAEWVAAQDLAIGDALVGHDGVEMAVEGVAPSDLWLPVYNLRVEDYHTYFVGDDTWGFSVWSHNAECTAETVRLARFLSELPSEPLPVLTGRSPQKIARLVNEGKWGELRTYLTKDRGFSKGQAGRLMSELWVRSNDPMATIARGHGTALAGSAAEPNAIGGIYLLRDPQTNQIMRSGRTNDLARRRGEHATDPELQHLTFEAAHRTDVENVQRGLEQMLHQRHNPPLNDIGGVDPRNPQALLYREAAEHFLRNQ